ncbi:uncharacterized protein SAPINGB_P005695 [Magnusiomyces paraingens]|uniref:Probable quinone oxidoreductase n=1 Tax=Magnusiomyces paraingens TaxID=2606893 RepID=A0A5E8C1B5_9ASCO|nr:uncharacterized protein SAPINGB_P005695 [Saprochaete ingens]VVT57437.1 unnamed protein product [Saprochaete ingens]
MAQPRPLRRASTFPITQTAVRIHGPGQNPKVDIDASLPVLGEYDILVKNLYCGINFVDLYYIKGSRPIKKYPFTLGREAAGTVIKTGAKVNKFGVGDRVVYIADGAYAQHTAVDERGRVARIVDFVSPKEAAASLLQGLTAITLVREAYVVKPGDWVLVHAAAGGTGSLVVQMAAKAGARVIGVTSVEAKAATALENGAEAVVCYKTEDIATRVRELTGGRGVDAVFDSVGDASYGSSMESLAKRGTFVSYGDSSGAIAPVEIAALGAKSVKIVRHSLGNYVDSPEDWAKFTEEYWAMLKHGDLRVRVTKEYALEEVPQALKDLESGTTTGKLIVKVQ